MTALNGDMLAAQAAVPIQHASDASTGTAMQQQRLHQLSADASVSGGSEPQVLAPALGNAELMMVMGKTLGPAVAPRGTPAADEMQPAAYHAWRRQRGYHRDPRERAGLQQA